MERHEHSSHADNVQHSAAANETSKQLHDFFLTVLAGEDLIDKLDKNPRHDRSNRSLTEDELIAATKDKHLSKEERRTAKQLLLIEDDLGYQQSGALPSAPVLFDGTKNLPPSDSKREITKAELNCFENLSVRLMNANDAGMDSAKLAKDVMDKFGHVRIAGEDSSSYNVISTNDIDRGELKQINGQRSALKDAEYDAMETARNKMGNSNGSLDYFSLQSTIDNDLFSGQRAVAFKHAANVLFPRHASEAVVFDSNSAQP